MAFSHQKSACNALLANVIVQAVRNIREIEMTILTVAPSNACSTPTAMEKILSDRISPELSNKGLGAILDDLISKINSCSRLRSQSPLNPPPPAPAPAKPASAKPAAPAKPAAAPAKPAAQRDISAVVADLNNIVISATLQNPTLQPAVTHNTDAKTLTVDMGTLGTNLFTPGAFKSLIAAAQDARKLGYKVDLQTVRVGSDTTQRAELNKINLEGLTFHRLLLPYADLKDANLRGTVFDQRSNLIGTNLSGSNLTGMQVDNSDLSFANLNNTVNTSNIGPAIRESDLTSATFKNARWTKTHDSGGTPTPAIVKSNLSGANFSGMTFTQTNNPGDYWDGPDDYAGPNGGNFTQNTTLPSGHKSSRNPYR